MGISAAAYLIDRVASVTQTGQWPVWVTLAQRATFCSIRNPDIPVYWFGPYSDALLFKVPFHMTRLETLISEFKNNDRAYAHDFAVSACPTHSLAFDQQLSGGHAQLILTCP